MSAHRFSSRPSRQWSTAARAERAQFLAAIEEALNATRVQDHSTHALVALHLEGPARVRATLGDEAERALLTVVRERIRACLAVGDRMASLDAEEVQVLVACGPDASVAWRVAELLRSSVEVPCEVDGRPISIRGCIGIAMIQAHHDSAAAVIAEAFGAMHAGRVTGAATSSPTLDIDGATRDAPRHGDELHGALERGELRLHYQPIIGCRSGELAAVEALLRWQHPVRGCLRPAAFLDAMARAGLMDAVARWVVGEGARQAVEWRASVALDAPIAVNLSPRQLAEPLFVSHAMATIAAVGGSPRCVIFELTEDIDLGRDATAIAALRHLREHGYRVCIDDFGTGYSSLSYLQRLPVDALKIDRAFACGVESDPRQRAIVRAVVQLAHVLDLDVIAEGVERPEQLDTLRALGCDYVQGHHLSPPLPAAAMRAWLAARR